MLIFVHHCLDQVRQYIVCAGDLTPIPTRFYPALGRNYVDSDYPPHTYRSWDGLRGRVSDRINGRLAVEPKFRRSKRTHSAYKWNRRNSYPIAMHFVTDLVIEL